MSIDEVIDKYHSNIINGRSLDIDNETLLLFIKEFMEINNLKDEYQKGDVNRKELGKEILDRVKKMKLMMDIFKRILNSNTNKYTYYNYISDYNKAMELLLKLANEKDNKYIMKRFYVEQIGSLETRQGNREKGMFKGEIRVIGEKDVLDMVDDSISYDGSSFGAITTSIVKKYHSLVAITNHYYETNVLPCWYDLRNTKRRKFNVNGFFSELYCYTYDDELGSAVDILDNYIEIYGGDMEELSIDTIFKRMKDKQLVKKSGVK